MAQIHDVAALVIEEQNRNGHPVDKLQLQKLLYLIYGAHLRRTGAKPFTATFRAYRHGPVNEGVESTYRNVVPNRDPITAPVGGHPDRVDGDLAGTVHEVLDIFGGWTGPNLERLVKKPGSPWVKARGNLPTSAESREELTDRSILAWFLTHPVDPNQRDRTFESGDPEAEAEHDIAAGRVARFDDIDGFLASLG